MIPGPVLLTTNYPLFPFLSALGQLKLAGIEGIQKVGGRGIESSSQQHLEKAFSLKNKKVFTGCSGYTGKHQATKSFEYRGGAGLHGCFPPSIVDAWPCESLVI